MKSILITGAAGGFGTATARLFAANGYFVGLYDLDEAGLHATAREIGPERSCYQRLDVSDAEDCGRAVTHFTERTGGTLTVLLNNAGITDVGDFETLDLARQSKIVDVNLKGALYMAHHAFPHLRDTPRAQVINVASASGIHGNPELVTYSLTKRALNSFTESLDIAWEKYGITVSDVNPIYARTNMVTEYQKNHRRLLDKDVKLTPEDVARNIFDMVGRRQTHRYVGTDARFFARVAGLIPFRLKRAITKKVIGYE